MESNETRNTQSDQPTGVQRDRDTPLPQKPSFLYFTSVGLGVLVIILLATSAYYGIIRF
jgi:hypothetical protein